MNVFHSLDFKEMGFERFEKLREYVFVPLE